MKKRYLIPTLMLLSATGLTACSNGAGFILNGQPYLDGAAARVSPQLKAQKDGSVKTVIMKSTIGVNMKISQGYSSGSVKSTISGQVVVDLDAKTINGDYTVKASATGAGSQNTKVKFTAVEENDMFYITSGTEYDGISTSADLDKLYEEASYTIYSWNFNTQTADMTDALQSLQDSLGSEIDIQKIYNDITKNMYYVGDFESGNFEAGFGKKLSFMVGTCKVTYDGMKVTYKDCFIQSEYLGLTASAKEDNVKVTLSLTYKTDYSYTYRQQSVLIELKNSLVRGQTIFLASFLQYR